MSPLGKAFDKGVAKFPVSTIQGVAFKSGRFESKISTRMCVLYAALSSLYLVKEPVGLECGVAFFLVTFAWPLKKKLLAVRRKPTLILAQMLTLKGGSAPL